MAMYAGDLQGTTEFAATKCLLLALQSNVLGLVEAASNRFTTLQTIIFYSTRGGDAFQTVYL